MLVRPLSFSALAAFAFGAAAMLVAVSLWATYTRHTTVPGMLVPDAGVIGVPAPQQGTIVEKRVHDGQRVERGDVLFVMSSERSSSARGATAQAVTEELLERQASLGEEIEATRRLEALERSALSERIALLSRELDGLRAAAARQRERTAQAEDAAARYRSLGEQGFVSVEQTLVKREAALEQQALADTLVREQAALERQRADARNELAALALNYANRIAALEREAGAYERELAENETLRGVLVSAPMSGTVTALVGEVGQTFVPGELLATIVPAGARLQAHLRAPSAAVGFIEPGDSVLLRYDAYPYQQFGHQRGTVASLSLAPVSGGAQGPPYYRLVVDLASQTLDAYGHAQPLRAGMAVEADVLGETRRLYEWVLDPLYSITEKLH